MTCGEYIQQVREALSDTDERVEVLQLMRNIHDDVSEIHYFIRQADEADDIRDAQNYIRQALEAVRELEEELEQERDEGADGSV